MDRDSDRYKAAIEGAGITDWLSFVPTSDIWQVDYDARVPEKDPAPFLQFSAVIHADQVTTPLLILHGESDLRVLTFQAREFFALLAERGKTVGRAAARRFHGNQELAGKVQSLSDRVGILCLLILRQ